MNRKHKEYGGFLPLELNPGQEYYYEYEDHMVRFNCAKAAVAQLLEHLDICKIHVPYYLCPNVCSEIEKHGIEVSYYHIGRDLLPEKLSVQSEKEAVYLVNYFGVMGQEWSKMAEDYSQQCLTMIDNCHSFFSDPMKQENIYNIYSAKKFFGVPDGAYMISAADSDAIREETYAHSYASYLVTCYEKGTNICYSEKKAADSYIAQHYGAMSVLSRGLLQNVDYDRVKKIRMENCKLYEKALGSLNQIQIAPMSAPYMYPFYIGEKGSGIKAGLVQEKIYVPTLWGGSNLMEHGNEFELSLANHAVFLPVDQRYDAEDIQYIIERVMEKINEIA